MKFRFWLKFIFDVSKVFNQSPKTMILEIPKPFISIQTSTKFHLGSVTKPVGPNSLQWSKLGRSVSKLGIWKSGERDRVVESKVKEGAQNERRMGDQKVEFPVIKPKHKLQFNHLKGIDLITVTIFHLFLVMCSILFVCWIWFVFCELEFSW